MAIGVPLLNAVRDAWLNRSPWATAGWSVVWAVLIYGFLLAGEYLFKWIWRAPAEIDLDLHQSHDADIASINAAHELYIKEVKRLHANEKSLLEQTHQQHLAELKVLHSDAINGAEREWANAIKAHKFEITQLDQRHEEALTRAATAHESIKVELIEAKKRRSRFEQMEKEIDEIRVGWRESPPNRLPNQFQAQRPSRENPPLGYIDYCLEQRGCAWRFSDYRALSEDFIEQ